MSAAFDTIRCHKLLEIAKEVLSKDGAMMLRFLLTDATIEIKIKDERTTSVTSHIGAPQGGSYSGPQFELYFENSLRNCKSKRFAWRNDLCLWLYNTNTNIIIPKWCELI